MAWSLQSSQRLDRKQTSKSKKRVSFAPDQATKCPPHLPKQGTKQVPFTSDSKPGSRNGKSASTSKTSWPLLQTKFFASTKGSTTGLSSVQREFETRKTAPKPAVKPILKPALKPVPKPELKPAPEAPKRSTAPSAAALAARVSITADGKSHSGLPKARHQKPGYDWVSYKITVKPTGKDWRREEWAR